MQIEREFVDKLEIIIKLLSYQITEEKDFKDQVKLLSTLGLAPREIADILNKTPNNVRVTLNYLKKIKDKQNAKRTK